MNFSAPRIWTGIRLARPDKPRPSAIARAHSGLRRPRSFICNQKQVSVCKLTRRSLNAVAGGLVFSFAVMRQGLMAIKVNQPSFQFTLICVGEGEMRVK